MTFKCTHPYNRESHKEKINTHHPYIKEDLIGKTFGNWTVICQGPKDRAFRTWIVVCTCGNKGKVREVNLKKGRSKSCGCMRVKYYNRSKLND